jgi:hypothetical protein
MTLPGRRLPRLLSGSPAACFFIYTGLGISYIILPFRNRSHADVLRAIPITPEFLLQVTQ